MKKIMIYLIAHFLVAPVVYSSAATPDAEVPSDVATLPPGDARYYEVSTFERAGRSLRMIAGQKECKNFLMKPIQFSSTVNGISKRKARPATCAYQYNLIVVEEFYLPAIPDFLPSRR